MGTEPDISAERTRPFVLSPIAHRPLILRSIKSRIDGDHAHPNRRADQAPVGSTPASSPATVVCVQTGLPCGVGTLGAIIARASAAWPSIPSTRGIVARGPSVARLKVSIARLILSQTCRHIQSCHTDPIVRHAIIDVEAIGCAKIVASIDTRGEHHIFDRTKALQVIARNQDRFAGAINYFAWMVARQHHRAGRIA